MHGIGAQHGWGHYAVTLADGREAFAKVSGTDTRAAFDAEARGLRWLAEAMAVPIPEVLGWDERALVLSWVAPGRADAAAAVSFGRELARLHAAGAASFGAPWPGFIASLPLDNTPWPARAWLGRMVRRAPHPALPAPRRGRRDAQPGGRPAGGDGHRADRRARRPAEPPCRIHGDCWSGNVMWSAGRGWLIDPAAHGGHRETDLAMLALFGAPHLEHIIHGYTQAAPLAHGWRSRVPLHQLHPLLVHVCLFGAGYRDAALAAARAALSS